MGRSGTGVEVRGKAIRIQFSLEGEVIRRTLKRDGATIPPSTESLGDRASARPADFCAVATR